MKLHKECMNKTGEGLTPCKVSYDPTTAKEMLLMATNLEEQQFWVARLLKKIQKGGFKAAGQVFESLVRSKIFFLNYNASFQADIGVGGSGSRISPQESLRSQYKPNIQVRLQA